MSTQLQLRSGTAAQHATFTGAVAEVTVVTDNNSLRVHDGVTVGGNPVGGGGGVILANYAALRAYSGALSAGTSVRITGGYYSNFWGISGQTPDGTAGVFDYNSADTTTADNGGTIIVDALGRRWYRKYDGALQAEWFGAVPCPYEGTAVDSTTAINNAVAAAVGQELHFGPGQFWTSGITWAYASPVLITGMGCGVTRIYHNAGNATPLVYVSGTPSTTDPAYPYFGFRGITFGSGNQTTALIWFDSNIDNGVIWENLGFDGTASAAAGNICDAISVNDFLNFNVTKSRFDKISGYAFNIRDAIIFSSGHFSCDQWTYDNGTGYTAGNGEGIMLITASAGTDFKGVVSFTNARIELNSVYTTAQPAVALFRIVQDSTGVISEAQPSQANFFLQNVSINASGTKNNQKIFSTNVGQLGIQMENVTTYYMNEIWSNDTQTNYEQHINGTAITTIKSYFSISDYYVGNTETTFAGIFGMKYGVTNSDYNMTSLGGSISRGDWMYSLYAPNTSGTSIGLRPFAMKAVQPRTGGCFISPTPFSVTASTTAGSNVITFSGYTGALTALGPGIALDVAGAGTSGGTWQAMVRSVTTTSPYTATMDSNAPTTVTGASVQVGTAQYAFADMVFASSGAVPTTGAYNVGDICKNTAVSSSNTGTGSPVITWVCVGAGTPGTWLANNSITIKGPTSGRPTLTASEQGVRYLDTTIAANGEPIVWTGTAWVNSVGTSV